MATEIPVIGFDVTFSAIGKLEVPLKEHISLIAIRYFLE
jgi:hypothetical protein